MEIIEMERTYRSFRKKEFEDYFSERGKYQSPSYYVGNGWEVHLGEERKAFVGPMEFIEITIYLKISSDIVEDFIIHLRKSFLKGGG